MGETDLPEQTFPVACGYSFAEVLDDRFYLGEPSELCPDSLRFIRLQKLDSLRFVASLLQCQKLLIQL